MAAKLIRYYRYWFVTDGFYVIRVQLMENLKSPPYDEHFGMHCQDEAGKMYHCTDPERFFANNNEGRVAAYEKAIQMVKDKKDRVMSELDANLDALQRRRNALTQK